VAHLSAEGPGPAGAAPGAPAVPPTGPASGHAPGAPAAQGSATAVVLAGLLAVLRAAGVQVLKVWSWMRDSISRRWRTSLQFRTVVTTLLIAAIAVVGVGGYLAGQISNGLFTERLVQAQQESARGATQVQDEFSNASLSDQPRVSTYVRDTLQLLTVGGADDNRKYLMVLIPGQYSKLNVSSVGSVGVTTAIIPDDLRAEVQADPDSQYWQSIALPTGTSGTHPA